ncbi:SPT3 Dosage dependent suppressor of Ty-induced promoter mutations-like protein [Tulasnella sp. 427]|nr:SPT3 Dosage dependent suppressor of Ty-induced promoter mutations-like protein [Tulasnella sp. 427]
MTSAVTRPRSPSSTSTSDSPATSHSSPASSDFQSPDHGLSRSPPANNRLYSSPSHLKYTPEASGHLWAASGGMDLGYPALLGSERDHSELLDLMKADDEQDALSMMGFIRKESYDPTPMSVISPQAMYLPHTIHPDASVSSNSHSRPIASSGTLEQPITYETSQPYPGSTANTYHYQEADPTAARRHTTYEELSSNNASTATSQAGQSISSPPPVEPIYPPKSSCSNLHVLVPNLPERGAKSRVETQIKIDIELSMLVSDPKVSSGQVYRPVGSWKWLRLSKGASTKRRAKKDVKQESSSSDTLYLSTEVYCATAPHPRVHACSSCIGREVKKNERKKATRVRPVPEDSSDDETSRVPQIVVDQIRAAEKEEDDGSRIVLFNCPDLMEFNTGRASLPVRVTCYCRHHREKVGFRILMTLRDCLGRVVGQGYTPPIMITDDHKSTQKSMAAEEEDGDFRGTGEPASKRKRKSAKRDFERDGDAMMDIPPLEEADEDEGSGRVKRKMNKAAVPGGRKPSSGASFKPPSKNGYASGRSSRLGTPSRRSSPSLASRSFTQPSPVTPYATMQASQTPHGVLQSAAQIPTNFDFNAMAAAAAVAAATSPTDSSNLQQTQEADGPSAEALLAACEGLAAQDGGFVGMALQSSQQQPGSSAVDLLTSPFSPYQHYPASSPSGVVTAPTSPLSSANPLGSPTFLDPSLSMLAGSLLTSSIFQPTLGPSSSPVPSQTMGGMGALTQAPASAADPTAFQTVPPPIIHRLIPNHGPMRGGIEITILGSNFSSNLQCTFGDSVSSQTTMWSENTIVCLLPASPSPGPVVVWFKDVPLGVNTMGLTSANGVDPQFGLSPGNSLQFFTYTDEADRALMELALQVVGLKMTGRIGQAKEIAMRIVQNNTGMDISGGIGGAGIAGGSQLAEVLTSSLTSHRSSTASRSNSSADLPAESSELGTSRDFQSSIISLLSVADEEMGAEAPMSIPLPQALTFANPEGQTLLHLAAILGFHRLIKWLLERGADVDARDKNGFTALHFSASSGRFACTRLLLQAGADLEVVDGRGRRAAQLAHLYDQPDVEALLEQFESGSESPLEEDYEGDAGVSGSGEEEDVSAEEDDTVWMGGERDSSGVSSDVAQDAATNRSHGSSCVQSALPSRTGSQANFEDRLRPKEDLYASSDEGDDGEEPPVETRRRVAGPVLQDPEPRPNKKVDRPVSWIHRYLPPPPAIMPDWIPNVQMPGIMAFPVQVPWPASFNWQGNQANDEKAPRMYSDLSNWRNWYPNAAIGWRSEKTARPEVPSVPMYAPSEDEVAQPVAYEDPNAQSSAAGASGSSKAVIRAKLARRLGAEGGHVTDKDIQAYTHYSQKMRRLKQDRMLFLFWLPILLIVIAWGLYETLPVAIGALKSSVRHLIPFRDPLHA